MVGMTDDDQQSLFADLPAMTPPSRVQQRLIRSAVDIEADDPDAILFQHTVFCQTGLPYRNPGAQVREWERLQGRVALKVNAGEAFDPETGKWIKLGLPFGPKPRLILVHLNREALIHGSPEIEVGASLTAFAKRLFGYDPNGKEIRKLKDQLGSLSAAMIRLAVTRGDQAFQLDTKVITAFDLWFPKDERQRVLWPSIVRLSLDYFESLQRHAVPLDERAIAALSHSAMGLDIYAWLAQRLHRVEPRKPAFVPWTALKAQFGWHYGRMDNFKRVFRQTLTMVVSQYRGARLELDGRGMTLRNSLPPVKGRLALISKA
jgi:Plasmid encoded RepA protein